MSSLEIADQVVKLDNQILKELDEHLRAYMVSMAVSHPVSGYDTEDLLQELRIKIWDKIRQGKYDPNKSKPITYFSWVFRTTLYNLNSHQKRACRIDAYNYSESLDELTDTLEREPKILSTTPLMVFCDLCHRLIDPHSDWNVYESEDDRVLACHNCSSETGLIKYT